MHDINGESIHIDGELSSAGARVVEIDVTDDASVTSGVNNTITGLGGLDVLINNAGVGVLGMQEFFTPADFHKVFDINVFGVQQYNEHLEQIMTGLYTNFGMQGMLHVSK